MTTILGSARPQPGTFLCRLDELADPGSKGFRFRAGDAMFAGFLVLKDGVLKGWVDACPHAGWPLGRIDGGFLTRENDFIYCAGHGALFRVQDGRCMAGPGGGPLTPWPVEVVDGLVMTASW